MTRLNGYGRPFRNPFRYDKLVILRKRRDVPQKFKRLKWSAMGSDRSDQNRLSTRPISTDPADNNCPGRRKRTEPLTDQTSRGPQPINWPNESCQTNLLTRSTDQTDWPTDRIGTIDELLPTELNQSTRQVHPIALPLETWSYRFHLRSTGMTPGALGPKYLSSTEAALTRIVWMGSSGSVSRVEQNRSGFARKIEHVGDWLIELTRSVEPVG